MARGKKIMEPWKLKGLLGGRDKYGGLYQEQKTGRIWRYNGSTRGDFVNSSCWKIVSPARKRR